MTYELSLHEPRPPIQRGRGEGGGPPIFQRPAFSFALSFLHIVQVFKHLIIKDFLFMKFGLQTLRGALRHRGRPRWCWLVYKISENSQDFYKMMNSNYFLEILSLERCESVKILYSKNVKKCAISRYRSCRYSREQA